jgi:hypothetical protein
MAAVFAQRANKAAQRKNLLGKLTSDHILNDEELVDREAEELSFEHEEEDENFEWQQSLTVRRRHWYLLQPVNNRKVFAHWKLAMARLRGFLMFLHMLKDIQQFGTSAKLFDVNGCYKKNLEQIFLKKQRTEKTKLKKKKKVKIPWHLINPQGGFKQIWNVILLILLMYTFTAMPYFVAFKETEIGDDIWILDTVVDILFFFDIVITFNTAFEV